MHKDPFPHAGQLPGKTRLWWLRMHFTAWIVVTVVVGALNMVLGWNHPWFLLPLVGWGTPLAIHVAFVMGLFGGSTD